MSDGTNERKRKERKRKERTKIERKGNQLELKVEVGSIKQ